MTSPAIWLYCLFLVNVVSAILQEETHRTIFIQDLFDGTERVVRPKQFRAGQFGKVSHFTTHVASNSLFVAVNDSVLRLQMDTFTEVDRVTWSLSTIQTEECRRAATDQMEKGGCQQYSVTLLHVIEDALPPDVGRELRSGLLVCLTNQLYAECSIRKILDLRAPAIISWKGAQHCPFSVDVPVSATRASDRSLFIAGKFDEDPTSKAAILRLAPDSMLSSAKSENRFPPRTAARLNWIVQDDKSVFVASFEFHNAVYFIFREAANEAADICKTEPIVSRIGRVCLSDRGLKTGHLHSFLKTSLICPGAAPAGVNSDQLELVHTHVRSVHVDQASKRLFATFSTPSGDFSSSAVCEYSFNEIEAVFDGPFFDARGFPTKFYNHIQCSAYSHQTLGNINQLIDQHLMYNTVQPVGKHPIMVNKGHIWTSLAIDWAPVSPKADDNLIVFTISTEGVLYKWHHFKFTTCLLEQINFKQAFQGEVDPTESHRVHLERQTSKSTNQPQGLPDILVSTKDSVFRIPVARCDRLGHHRSACELLSDPYCIWNGKNNICEDVVPGIVLHRQLRYPEIYTIFESCPGEKRAGEETQLQKSVRVDGNWGVWSPWTSCSDARQSESGFSASTGFSVSNCQCRYRSCSSPFPHGNDGQSCQNGSSIELRGCRLSGGWTNWTPWFACEPKCRNVQEASMGATQTRRRWCTNPRPQGGGGECEGLQEMTRPCPHTIPACSAPGKPVSLPTWSPWSSWSNCSTDCGGGHRIRWRRCGTVGDSAPPPPLIFDRVDSVLGHNSLACLGSAYSLQTCSANRCPVTKVISAWTSWYVTEGSQQTGSKQRRFRVECLADVADADKLQAKAKFDQSICSTNAVGRSVCRRLDETSSMSHWLLPMDESTWSAWSDCTRACGQGKRYRWRKAKRLPGQLNQQTEAVDREEDVCNTHACPGYWSCWSQWSVCEGQESSCEKGGGHRGQQQRQRTCLVPVTIKPREGQNLDASQCDGGIEASQQARTCEAASTFDAACHNQRQMSRFKRYGEDYEGWIEIAVNQTENRISKRDAIANNQPVPAPWAEWSRCFSVGDLPYKVRLRVREFCEGCHLREVKRCDTDEHVTINPTVENGRTSMHEYLRVRRHSLMQLILAGVFATVLGTSLVVIPYLVCRLCKGNRNRHTKSSINDLQQEGLLTTGNGKGQNNRPYIWFAENDSSPAIPQRDGMSQVNRPNMAAPQRYASLTRIQALHNDHIKPPVGHRRTQPPWNIAEEVQQHPDTLAQNPTQYNKYDQETLALLMSNERVFQAYNPPR